MALLFSLAWRSTLPNGVSLPSLFLIRTAGEAVNIIIGLAVLTRFGLGELKAQPQMEPEA